MNTKNKTRKISKGDKALLALNVIALPNQVSAVVDAVKRREYVEVALAIFPVGFSTFVVWAVLSGGRE